MKCPCGSGHVLEDCCGVYLTTFSAPDPEALMRSRYTAYVLARYDYLVGTWHASTRPDEGSLGGTGLDWIGLEVIRSSASDSAGMVEFNASYVDRGRGRRLHEVSRFVHEDGRWFYADGDSRVSDVGRNDACPCGSGKKFKRCCAGCT